MNAEELHGSALIVDGRSEGSGDRGVVGRGRLHHAEHRGRQPERSTIVIAEKATDLILGNAALPAEDMPVADPIARRSPQRAAA